MKPRAEYGGGLMLSGLSKEQEEQVIADLTFPNPKYLSAIRGGVSEWGLRQIPKNIVLAEKTGEGILVPRGYDYKKRFNVSSLLINGTEVDVSFPKQRISLRKDQKSIIEEATKSMLSPGSGIHEQAGTYLFEVPTAVGKTIIGLSLSAILKQKTLVIVPTTLIRKGWFADIKKFFGIPASEIGLIQGANSSIGEQFTIAMAQTLDRRENQWQEWYSQFGTVIVDEPDQLVTRTKTFEFLRYCPAFNIIGLTATPYIHGGRQFYLDAIFGKVFIRRDVNEVEGAMAISDIKVIRTNYHFRFRMGSPDWIELAPDLTCDEARNQIIVDNVLEDLSRGETVLVNTKYLNHANILADMLNEHGVEDIVMITGETNASEQRTHASLTSIDNGNCRCVIASTAIKVGANIPRLQNLHLACPYANSRDIEQLIGRIRRKSDGKESCNVRYYLDGAMPYMHTLYTKYALPVFERHSGVRKKAEKKQNDYKVKRILRK